MARTNSPRMAGQEKGYNLTSSADIIYSQPFDQNNERGDECMSGKVYYHKPAKRFYIYIYWEGRDRKLWRDCDSLQPFLTRGRASKYLGIAQVQIDKDEFDPKHWKFLKPGEPDSPFSFQKYAMDWLENKDVDKRTWRGYKTDIVKHIIPYFGRKHIKQIRAKQIKQFKKHLEQIPLATKTVYNKMGTLKTLFRDACRDEDIYRVPAFPVLSTGQLDRPDSLTREQQERLILAIPERHRPIFEFGMELGLRVGEVRAIQKSCLRDGRAYIEQRFSDNRLLDSTKTGLNRYYDLTEHEQEILARALKRDHIGPFVFVREDGKPYTNKNLNKIFRPALKKAELPKIKLQNAMRHSLGCQLVDEGHPLDLVQEQLGHTDIRTTRRYAQRSGKTLAKVREGRGAEVIPIRKEN